MRTAPPHHKHRGGATVMRTAPTGEDPQFNSTPLQPQGRNYHIKDRPTTGEELQ